MKTREGSGFGVVLVWVVAVAVADVVVFGPRGVVQGRIVPLLAPYLKGADVFDCVLLLLDPQLEFPDLCPESVVLLLPGGLLPNLALLEFQKLLLQIFPLLLVDGPPVRGRHLHPGLQNLLNFLNSLLMLILNIFDEINFLGLVLILIEHILLELGFYLLGPDELLVELLYFIIEF